MPIEGTHVKRARETAMHSRWEGVIGPEAAGLRVNTSKARGHFANSLFSAAVVAVVAAFLQSQVGRDVAIGLILALIANSALWLYIWFDRRDREYRAASDFLGIEITSANYPPSDPKAFERWCDRRGVFRQDHLPAQSADEPRPS
jgi:hypothetical protein